MSVLYMQSSRNDPQRFSSSTACCSPPTYQLNTKNTHATTGVDFQITLRCSSPKKEACICVRVCILTSTCPIITNDFLARDLHRGNCSISTGYMHFEICILLCHFCLFWIFSNKIGETSPRVSAFVVTSGRLPVSLPALDSRSGPVQSS